MADKMISINRKQAVEFVKTVTAYIFQLDNLMMKIPDSRCTELVPLIASMTNDLELAKNRFIRFTLAAKKGKYCPEVTFVEKETP